MKSTIFWIMLVVKMSLVMGSCDLLFGPTGTKYECIKFDGYNSYQWAICYSNSYIKAITDNKHRCSQSNANYCYFQCMIEKHDRASGRVYDDCACDGIPTTVTSETTTAASKTVVVVSVSLGGGAGGMTIFSCVVYFLKKKFC